MYALLLRERLTKSAVGVKVPGPRGVTYVAGLQPMSTVKVDRKNLGEAVGGAECYRILGCTACPHQEHWEHAQSDTVVHSDNRRRRGGGNP